MDLSVFPDEVRNEVDDNWGESVSMEHDFSIEEILDMPTEGEVQMNLTKTDCVGHDFFCKVVSTPIGAEAKTGDYKEPDYIEADNESHDKSNHGIFCVTEKDSDCIDIDDMYRLMVKSHTHRAYFKNISST